jgi:cytoskeletal protein CcmA (bactofilin family)
MATSAPARKRRWFVIVALVVLGVPAIALAQQQLLGGKFRSGNEVVIPAGEQVTGDLYAAGGTVRIEGAVEGDLVATGGQVEITGEVGGDLIASGGNVRISGRVVGDVRVGAGQVTIDGSIGEDLLAGSGQLTISSGGEVGEDLVFGTGRTTMDGAVAGDVLGATGSYVREGSVGGTEDVTVDRRGEEAPSAGDRVLDGLRRFVALLAVGALLLWLAPWSVERPATTLRRRPWASLGLGFVGIVALVVVFIAIIVATIVLLLLFGLLGLGDLAGLTVFTSVTALVVLSFLIYVTFAFIAQLVVAIALGRLAFGEAGGPLRFASLALGAVVVVVLTSLPVVGGWVMLLVVLLGVGAIIITLNALRRRDAGGTVTPTAT